MVNVRLRLAGMGRAIEAKADPWSGTVSFGDRTHRIDEWEWAAPVDGAMYGVALNDEKEWEALSTEMNAPPYEKPPEGPVLYMKPANTINAHRRPVLLPRGVFNVVHGFGETAGAALVAHPDVRLISFTGETTTGMEIIRNSAATLKKTSMELGGKSPLIVFADADLDRALDAAVWGVFSLNGERCTANSRLLLEQSIYDEFVARLKERVDRIVIGDPMNPATELGPLIHRDHWERVNRYIEIAKQEGADVYAPGVPKGLERGNFVPPTLLLNCRNDMKVAQEEIFGPVMAVMSFTSEEEAIRLANDVKYGLAAYVWTNDMKRGHRVAQAIESGMAWVNSPNVRDLRIPFGGTKYSGIGREGGHYSFDFYTEVQVVHVAVGDPPIPAFGKGEK